MTVSRGFILSLVYVLSMSLAYTIAGVIAGILNRITSGFTKFLCISNFCSCFVALAFSMFGYYEIKLPDSLQTRLNKTTDGKRETRINWNCNHGIFICFNCRTCVAPPLAGALVYIGQTGDAVLGGVALFVMSLGMGVPLLIIGAGAGKFMPKPGGWMEGVTRIFGIVMLGVAIWLLDRVLNPTVIMFLWSFLLLGSAIYLKTYRHILTQLITVAVFLLGVVLFVGAISGATNPLKPLEKFTQGVAVQASSMKLDFKKIKNISELNQAIKESDKPIMLDFWASWCVSCKELEEITFKDEEVIKKLQGFTLLKADVSENSADDIALQKMFGVVGPPALIFWDKDKNEVKASRIVGYKNPKEFLEIVNKNF
ncbi:MAG: protein-disulfide reductase DsbD [Aliarcobacter sp.]